MAQQGEKAIEIFQDHDFGDKLAFTVGTSYALGFVIGLGRGLRMSIPKSFKMPKKLIMNNFFNAVGRDTTRFGNAFASAGLLYYMMAGGMNLLFEDEIEDMKQLHKNLICGAATGMLYKSTLGVVPCIVGGILGASIIGGLSLLIEEGNNRGLIAF